MKTHISNSIELRPAKFMKAQRTHCELAQASANNFNSSGSINSRKVNVVPLLVIGFYIVDAFYTIFRD